MEFTIVTEYPGAKVDKHGKDLFLHFKNGQFAWDFMYLDLTLEPLQNHLKTLKKFDCKRVKLRKIDWLQCLVHSNHGNGDLVLYLIQLF